MSAPALEKKVKKTSSKSKKIDAVESDAPVIASEPIAAAAPVKKERKEKKASAKEADLSQAAAESAPAEAPAEAGGDSAVAGDEEKLSRKKRTYVQLVSEVDSLNEAVDRFILDHRDPKNTDMNRFLKVLEKGLRKVRVHVQKIGKNRSNVPSAPGVQSGFQKPVRISNAVADFTGWDSNEPRARVEVTNFVCDYIKQHNLQSPDDRRVILADQRLTQLLEYQQERDGNLTYATIQKLLAKHYTPLSAAS
jgi:chromatin remodeling complex protein RSC6